MNNLLSTIAVTPVLLATLAATSVQAQVAEVPAPNRKGDFTTAKVLGNRGYYENRKWLVVDFKPGLNCRATPNGAIKSVLMPGSVISAVFSGNNDAVVLHQGSPWLRVNVQAPVMSGTPGTCFVRANIQHIAPINAEFVQGSAIGMRP